MIWEVIKTFEDIRYERGVGNAEGTAKITINRPEVRNAFRPKTVFEVHIHIYRRILSVSYLDDLA